MVTFFRRNFSSNHLCLDTPLSICVLLQIHVDDIQSIHNLFALFKYFHTNNNIDFTSRIKLETFKNWSFNWQQVLPKYKLRLIKRITFLRRPLSRNSEENTPQTANCFYESDTFLFYIAHPVTKLCFTSASRLFTILFSSLSFKTSSTLSQFLQNNEPTVRDLSSFIHFSSFFTQLEHPSLATWLYMVLKKSSILMLINIFFLFKMYRTNFINESRR